MHLGLVVTEINPDHADAEGATILALPREVFLAAITGDNTSRAAADAVVIARLGEASP